MPLQSLDVMLGDAHQNHYAVPGFGVCDSLVAAAVMRAATAAKAPVVLIFSPPFEDLSPISTFTPMLLAQAQLAGSAASVQYQFAHSLDEVAQALGLGFPAVGFDGSALPLDQNIHFTRQAADMCRDANASCEGVLGNPDDTLNPFTDVQEAVDFVGETRVDALAVAIGNHHRTFPRRPELNLEHLKELSSSVDVPLTLHGGSELSQEDIGRAAASGISQINFSACLLGPALTAWRDSTGAYMEAARAAQAAVQTVAAERIRLTGSTGRGAV